MTKAVRRLLPFFKPENYKINLDLTKREKRSFSGRATITGTAKEAGQIILHSKDLAINKVTVDDQQVNFELLGKTDELVIKSNKIMQGSCTITIDFDGKINDAMHGLYPCYFKHDGKDKELLMTQLESHHARELFPCIDEPAAKAVFEITLTTEQGVTVLSNTPAKSQINRDKALVTEFEPTPKMSTYLLAFVIGELEYLETTNKHGVLVRTYATPDNVKHTKFALELAAKTLDYYDDYFDVPYPLQKCDMVAVPDFAAGAMENWGLVTYRESCMLVDPKNTPADVREWVATVVTHELSHQWFGNLVTMEWWDDLWLNESFAKWMEHYSVDHFYPEWKVWEQFAAGEQQGALARDGLANVQAVRQPVYHPDELHSLFDSAIVYTKGSCLIRMLHEYLGADDFKKGLRLYMKRHQYSNTVAQDLWTALSEASGKDIAAFMNRWINQPGHPVVNVDVSENKVAISQKRFFANPTQAKKGQQFTWTIPLLSNLSDDTLDSTKLATTTKTSDLVFVNSGYTGFYHTKYNVEHLEKLAQKVKNGELSIVDRLSLLTDGVALAKAGLSSTSDLIALTANYKNEKSFPVWNSIGSVVATLKILVNNNKDLKPHLQKYVRNLAISEYKRLGWEHIKGESYFDELQRPNMISYMAYAKDQEVINKCLQIFDNASRPEDITPNIRSIVYSVASHERGENAYNKLLSWYKKTTSAEERMSLAAGITFVKNQELAHKITALFTTKTIKQQDLFYWFIYLIRTEHGKAPAWQWMTENWQWISDTFKGSHDYSDFPKYAANALSTQEYLDKYREFFTPKMDETAISRVITQGLEDIEVRVLWRERDLQAVSKFLKSI
ncbi:MAG: M1 family metallopeptidase [Candidatus Woesebacteria bacterium]|jgi:aminopeptidase N